MLKEEQVAELLTRCERLVSKELPQIRGNLRNSITRSAAVWELLVIEAASKLGRVEYEPYPDGCPDIKLHFPQGRFIWIEIAFLYPKFWMEERQSKEITNWITRESLRRGISEFTVSCHFDGDRSNPAGPVRYLPKINQKKQFLAEVEVKGFFTFIQSYPGESHSQYLSKYSMTLSYSPNAVGPYLSTGGGLVQESAKIVKQHAVYRVLKGKAKQHSVTGPRIICIGSDQSPSLSTLNSPGDPTLQDAVYAAFAESTSLSGAIVIRIESSPSFLGTFEKSARGTILLNPQAKAPITEADSNLLSALDFNRWNFFSPLEKTDRKNNDSFRRVGGSLSFKLGGKVEIEVPTNILIDSLAGKTSLIKEYGLAPDDRITQYLNEGWQIKSCRFKEGNIEAGEASKIVFEIVPPPNPVFWPK